MANALYPSILTTLLSGGINLLTANLKVSLVSGSYTYNGTHQLWSQVSGNAIGAPQSATGITITSGRFDCADVLFPSVASGALIGSVHLWDDTGTPATCRLVGHFDTMPGLPAEGNGGDITIASPSGWFQF